MLSELEKNTWDWLSLHWFYPSTFYEFQWENLPVLYLILILPFPFLIRRLIHRRLGQKVEVSFSEKQLQWHPVSLLRFLPDILMSLCIFFILIALARPQHNNKHTEYTSEGIDILLVMDVSKSMLIQDFKPNRMEASKEIAKQFIHGRKYDRIGLIVFAGEAYSLSPLTTDYYMLDNYIQQIHYPIIQQEGTAIGTALGVATNRMKGSTAKSKVVILISDGDNTAGNLDPQTAAQLAAYYGIKLYTIVVGKEGRVPINERGKISYVKNTVDETTLRKIAKIGEGKFFRVENNQALKEVFTRINQYEKSEIIENHFNTLQDYYTIYLNWAVVCLLCWLLLKNTFVSNILED